jgi:hypothetical protein
LYKTLNFVEALVNLILTLFFLISQSFKELVRESSSS